MTEEVHQVNIYIPSQGSLTRVVQRKYERNNDSNNYK